MTASWHDFAQDDPELAAYVRRRLEEPGLVLLATLRADGSPRISGLEPVFGGGELWLAMMPDSVKGADLRRDGRFALHNATVDKDVADGDVKVSGVAEAVAEPDRPGLPELPLEADLFATRLAGVATVRVGDGELLIDTWRPGRGTTRRTRT